MSTKHVRTTGDLVRFGCDLKIDCCACGASKTMSGPAAATVLGVVELRRAAARLKCGRCGKKEARLVVLDPIGATHRFKLGAIRAKLGLDGGRDADVQAEALTSGT
jgi:hypothetical protein